MIYPVAQLRVGQTSDVGGGVSGCYCNKDAAEYEDEQAGQSR